MNRVRKHGNFFKIIGGLVLFFIFVCVSTLSAQIKEITEEKGVLPGSSLRPLKKDTDEKMNEFLKIFDTPSQDISYCLKSITKKPDFNLWELTFPSLITSPFSENNTVYGEYYQSFGNAEKKPAVVVLDISQGNLMVARLIAYRLALQSVNSLILHLPYCGKRQPQSLEKVGLVDDIKVFQEGIMQAVSDIRVAAAWLATRPENNPAKIGICGASLGGIAAALTAGVDGNFPKAAFLLTGGDLFTIFKQNSEETRKIRKIIEEKKVSDDELQAILAPIDPLSYAKRMEQTDVLMVNMEKDAVIPASSVQKYQKALPQVKAKWYPGDHKDLIPHAFEVLTLVSTHFAFDNW